MLVGPWCAARMCPFYLGLQPHVLYEILKLRHGHLHGVLGGGGPADGLGVVGKDIGEVLEALLEALEKSGTVVSY